MIHDKASIADQLLKNTASFASRFSQKSLSEKPDGWPAAPQAPGKWSPMQHLDHLCLSVSTVNKYLRWLPRWFFRWRFGKPNRAGRTYEQLVARYEEKLATQNPALNPFSSGGVAADRLPGLLQAFENEHVEFVRLFSKWPEYELDSTLMPHPLLGKISMREMLFFMVDHVRHHERIVEKI